MKNALEQPDNESNEDRIVSRKKTYSNNSKIWTKLRLVAIALIIITVIVVGSKIDLEQLREQIQQLGVWAWLAVFGLRFTSVVFPVLPGTAYSLFAGSFLGFIPGVITICSADLCSCSLSFCLSRRYGRNFISRLIGDRSMERIDCLSQKHLENNFFLMTGCLMTGFFDFVCYAVGLTKTSWKRFIPALIVSILISNLPIVAMGAGIFGGGKMMLGLSVLGCFSLGYVTYLLKRKKIL